MNCINRATSAIVLIAICLFIKMAIGGYNVTILSDMQKDVRDLLGTDADPYHPNDTLTNFINTACREIASYGVIVKVDSIVVTGGDRVKDLNEDCLEISAVFPCSTKGVRAYSRIEFRDWGRIAAATQETQTKYYAFQPAFMATSDTAYGTASLTGAKLWLYPAHSGVDDTLLVIYYAEANELSSANDTTSVPYAYVPLVVYYSTALAHARARNFNEAAWWFAKYDQTRQEKGLLKQLDFLVKPKVIE